MYKTRNFLNDKPNIYKIKADKSNETVMMTKEN